MKSTRLLPWRALDPREKAVWPVIYASGSTLGSLEAARLADAAIMQMRVVAWPDKMDAESPEHRAARVGVGLTYEQFKNWFAVEALLAHDSRADSNSLKEDVIADAYKTYAMCRGDFY
jgi:hypothetical protein